MQAEAASELSDLSAMQAEGFHAGNTLLSHAQVAERLGTRAYCCAGEHAASACLKRLLVTGCNAIVAEKPAACIRAGPCS